MVLLLYSLVLWFLQKACRIPRLCSAFYIVDAWICRLHNNLQMASSMEILRLQCTICRLPKLPDCWNMYMYDFIQCSYYKFLQSRETTWALALPNSTHPLIITSTDWFFQCQCTPGVVHKQLFALSSIIRFVLSRSLRFQPFTLFSTVHFVFNRSLCFQPITLSLIVCFSFTRLLHLQSSALPSNIHFICNPLLCQQLLKHACVCHVVSKVSPTSLINQCNRLLQCSIAWYSAKQPHFC